MELTPAACAFLLTALAGLCTGVGSVLAFFTHRTNRSFLAVSMGFSAGVMLYVSMVEILPKGRIALAAAGFPSGVDTMRRKTLTKAPLAR